MYRRSFLGLTAGLSFIPTLLQAQESKEDKACIFVYLHGGIASQEFINPVPEMGTEHRSVTGFQKGTNFLLGGSFEKLATITDKLSIVHSFAHRDGNHQSAAGEVLSGKVMSGLPEAGKMKEPYIGSIICNEVGPRNSIGIPSLVKVNKIDFAGARRDDVGWLGIKTLGFDADREGIENLKFGLPKNRIDARMEMVEFIDHKDSIMDRSWTALRREAYNIAIGKASEAFDLTKESDHLHTKFNTKISDFGRSALMAVRLIKSGSKFVQIVNGGWDHHVDIQNGFMTKGPELDNVLFSLLDELIKQGLLDKTLVVITTEFSRTKLNGTNGRDHNPNCVPLVFAGGGYNHGRIIGLSEKDALSVKDGRLTPEDLLWTISDHFGLPKHRTIIDSENRPHHLFKDDAKNILI